MFKDINKVLLITDLDGTLLPHSKVLSQVDLLAIEEFKRAGGTFSIATGRHYNAVSHYLNELKVNAPIILFNGATVYDTKTSSYIYSEFLSEKSRNLINDVITLKSNVCAEISTLESLYALQVNDMEIYHNKITKTNPIVCNSINEIPDNWVKVILAVEQNEMDDLISSIDVNKHTDMAFVKSCRMFYEILPKNVSKGTALEHLKKKCGLEDYTIVAVGDYNNDIEMIKFADVGIAPANACDEVKNVSDIVLDKTCDEGAIAEAIKYIFSKTNMS